MDVTVCIATFGGLSWLQLATAAALTSVGEQTVQPRVVVCHGATLAEARNEAARYAETEWLIYLDADDALDPNYVEATAEGTADLRAPRLFLGDGEVPVAERDIELTNPCCVGTAIRKDMLFDLGGWPDFDAWEDWALFLRAVRRGASLEHTEAIYRASSNAAGRNSTVLRPRHLHREIRAWA